MKIKHLMLIVGFVALQITAQGTAQAAGIESEEQLENLKRAAQYGSSEAMIMLSVTYANGEGVDNDEVIAMRWMREAIRNRNPQAYFVKSQWLRNGHVVDSDLERADYFLDRAVAAGHAPAMYEKAARKLREDMADQAAIELLADAADMGHFGSMYLLARLLENGMVSGEPEIEKAAALYSTLAIRNYRDSREKLRAYAQFFSQQGTEASEEIVASIESSLNMEVIEIRGDAAFANTLARLTETARRPTTGTRIRRAQDCGVQSLGCQVVFDRTNGVDSPAGSVSELIYGYGR
ncbi:MAG: sel1 repeat family protein [Idiomarina sp.]|nr:sel1 repeat family protein [Idiomarina sp.]